MAFYALQGLGALLPALTIRAMRRVRDPAVLAEARAAFVAINSPPYNARIGHDFGDRVWLVNTTCPPPSHLLGDASMHAARVPRYSMADVPRLRPHGAEIRSNYFHDSYTRFGLYDSPGQVIENNTFERGGTLMVGESGVGWLEGPPHVNGMVVRSNTFVDCTSPSAITVSEATTSHVVLQDNRCLVGGSAVPCSPSGSGLQDAATP